ncbi:MAG: hypothetical protein JSW39_04845 [Desulfobacterales bacterium]|nr:MAG: hypothetical protein JSW39_04845 [Desulfobacterales bacterium]
MFEFVSAVHAPTGSEEKTMRKVKKGHIKWIGGAKRFIFLAVGQPALIFSDSAARPQRRQIFEKCFLPNGDRFFFICSATVDVFGQFFVSDGQQSGGPDG